MDDLAQRIAALPPEKLALLERRLNQRLGQTGDAVRTAGGGNNGPAPFTDARQETAGRSSDLPQVERVLEPEHLRPDAFAPSHNTPPKPDGEGEYAAPPPRDGPPSGAEEMFVAPFTEAGKAVSGDGLGDAAGGSPNGHDAGMRMAEVDRLSDEDVNAFLSHLSSVGAAAEASPQNGRAAVSDQSPPEEANAGPITSMGRGESHDLLANLDQLSDEEVDSFLDNMFTEEEIEKAYSAINSPLWAQGWPERTAVRPPEPVSRTRPDSSSAVRFTAMSWAGAEARGLFEQAHLTYTLSLQAAGWNAQREIAEAHLTHMQAAREVFTNGGGQDLLDEAAKNYTLALQEARVRRLADAGEAYLKYVEEVQSLWVQLDVEVIDPVSLRAISHGMALVAHSASSNLGWFHM